MAKHLKISFWIEDGPEFCPLKRAALAPERACTKASWYCRTQQQGSVLQTALPRLVARAGPIRSRTSFDFDRPHGLADQRAHIAAVKTMYSRLMRARSSLHKWASGFQLAASITLICAGCALMRWSKSTLTLEICSTSSERRRCTLSSSDYSTSCIPGAVPAAVQLESPLSWAGASST